MFYDTMAAAIDATYPRQREQLDNILRDVWRAHGAGHLADDQAQELAERIHRRRPESAHALFSVGGPVVAPERYRIQRSPEQRSPDRRASIERRREHAATGTLPPYLAAQFTVGEQAVLRIVADEWQAHGACDRSLNELAARAGVCHSLAKRAIKFAELEGLISVQRRPRSGRKHLTNIVRIIRAEWVDWLRKGNRKAYAIKACERAKPVFGFRGVQKNPPRLQVLRNHAQPGVGNTVKKE
jgi:hypothetical protein